MTVCLWVKSFKVFENTVLLDSIPLNDDSPFGGESVPRSITGELQFHSCSKVTSIQCTIGLVHVGNEGLVPALPIEVSIPLCPFVLVNDPSVQCIYDGRAEFLMEGGAFFGGEVGDVVPLRGDSWFGFAHLEKGVSFLRAFSNVNRVMQSTAAYCPIWESNPENPQVPIKVEIIGRVFT
jgi:hypothetical protein